MENTKSKIQLRESSIRKAQPGEVAYVAWANSKGAKVERLYDIAQGKEIYYQGD